MSVLSEEMQRRCAEVHGEIIPEEGLLLAELAAQVPSDYTIIEIGAYKGKSTCYLAAGAQAGGGAIVYSIDLWERAPWPQYADPAVHRAWEDNIGCLGLVGKAIAICASSQEAAQLVDANVGLLWVDADHTYEGVRRDVELWSPKLALDGVMVFHDAATEHWGVARAIREKLLVEGRYTCEVQFGCAIVRRVL